MTRIFASPDHFIVPAAKNLIFDLGGVILDLSIDHTLESFSQLSNIPKPRIQEIYYSEAGFIEYEKGQIDDADFRHFVRTTFSVEADDDAIDASWNAMLRGIPPVKLELLTRLREHFRVFLLSNTNSIHLRHINGVMLQGIPGAQELDHYFERAYYSHLMGKRKPDAEIFEEVLEDNDLDPEETLFLDDYAVNIEGAQAVGIQTLHVTSPTLILDYFHA